MNFAQRIDLGGVSVRLLNVGGLKLDGGAMFGIIPKPLWSRGTPADERNRIQLACNCLLVEWEGASGRRVIIETGHGAKYDAKEQTIFDIDAENWLLPALEGAGVAPSSISDVVVSHLHFDHAGGLTVQRDGAVVPTFPHVPVHVQRQEYDDARANFGVMTATYRDENFAPIADAALWRLVDGEAEILPGVRAMLTPGHTRGHHSLIVEGRDRSLIFGGDVMPTAAHVGAPYNMGYDLFPIENRASKQKLLDWAADREALIVIDHEPKTPVVRVVREKQWYRLELEV